MFHLLDEGLNHRLFFFADESLVTSMRIESEYCYPWFGNTKIFDQALLKDR